MTSRFHRNHRLIISLSNVGDEAGPASDPPAGGATEPTPRVKRPDTLGEATPGDRCRRSVPVSVRPMNNSGQEREYVRLQQATIVPASQALPPLRCSRGHDGTWQVARGDDEPRITARRCAHLPACWPKSETARTGGRIRSPGDLDQERRSRAAASSGRGRVHLGHPVQAVAPSPSSVNRTQGRT